MKGYPRSFLALLVAVFVVLGLTGLLLIPTMLDLRLGWDVVWRLPGDQRTLMAATHSLAALLLCGFAGALWSVHMRAGWRGRRHLVTGLLTAGLLAMTALTAVGLLYLGAETLLVGASSIHTVLGIASIGLAGLHWAITIRERRGRALDRGLAPARAAR